MAEKKGVSEGRMYKCKVCKIIHPDSQEYTDHMNCKYDKIILKNEEKCLETASDFKDKVFQLKHTEKSFMCRGSGYGKSSEDKDDYICEVCRVVCKGIVNFKQHNEGKKHIKTLKKMKIQKQMEDTKLMSEIERKRISMHEQLFSETLASSSMECVICEKKFGSPGAYMQHCESGPQRETLSLWTMKREDPSRLSEAANCIKSSFAHCDVCKKCFSGPVPYQQHLKSSLHLGKVQSLKQMGQMQNLVLRSEVKREESGKEISCSLPHKLNMESIVHLKKEQSINDLAKMKDLILGFELNCEVCGKTFSGPMSFNDHMASSAHHRLKSKKYISKNMEKDHTEMWKYSVFGISGENVKDRLDPTLACETFHAVFSEREVACDQFTGVKHSEVSKKRAQLQKVKDVFRKQGDNYDEVSESDSSDDMLLEI